MEYNIAQLVWKALGRGFIMYELDLLPLLIETERLLLHGVEGLDVDLSTPSL